MFGERSTSYGKGSFHRGVKGVACLKAGGRLAGSVKSRLEREGEREKRNDEKSPRPRAERSPGDRPRLWGRSGVLYVGEQMVQFEYSPSSVDGWSRAQIAKV